MKMLDEESLKVQSSDASEVHKVEAQWITVYYLGGVDESDNHIIRDSNHPQIEVRPTSSDLKFLHDNHIKLTKDPKEGKRKKCKVESIKLSNFNSN